MLAAGGLLAFAALSYAAQLAMVLPVSARADDPALVRAHLAEHPADAAAWLTLARQTFLAGDDAGAVPYLMQSIEVAAYQPPLMIKRFQLALLLWSSLDVTQREKISIQLGLLWRKNRSELLGLSRLPLIAPQVEQMMRDSYPDSYASFLRSRGPVRHNNGAKE